MFTTLYFLGMMLTNGHAYDRVVGAATTVVNVVSREDASWAYPSIAKEDPDAARAKLGRLLMVWSYYESSYTPTAVGDSGRSCGVMQVQPGHVGKTCKDLLKARAGYEAGVAFLKQLVVQCGTLERALGAYASGTCGGAPELVAKRCALAGGC